MNFINMKLVLSILLPQTAGFVGSIFTLNAIPTWYEYLTKPSFAPPNWIFAPMWVTLYLAMGIAVYLNWISNNKQSKYNVRLFFIHLLFNFIWTPVFFGLKNLGLALIVILLLMYLIVLMIVKFWRVNKVSSILLIPYLIWVAFASLLNYYYWILN